MFPEHTLISLGVIAVIGMLAAFGIFHVVTSDEQHFFFKAVVIAFIVAAAAVGVGVMFYVVPAYWDD